MPPQPDSERRKRILAALGLPGKSQSGLRVDEQIFVPILRLSGSPSGIAVPCLLSAAASASPAPADRCEVIELLDPRTDLCDEIDGLYCRTRKGKFLVNLPLVELTDLPPSKNLELLGDYEYWFWHWRD